MSSTSFRIKEHFNSTAKVVYISRFRFGSFVHSNKSKATNATDVTFMPATGWWPKFPVLIQSNGEPWEIGNAYLMKKLESKQPWDMETIKSRANYLLSYLRFLEDTDTNFLHFPKRKSERVTYVFRSTLQDFIIDGLNPTYASNIISTVVDFYRTIIDECLIDEDQLSNLPFKNIDRFLRFLDSKGFSRTKLIKTSDLAISHTKPQKRSGYIEDGGQLRPLKKTECDAIAQAFKAKLCPYALELKMRIALTTGARMQTVCTLRECNIRKAYQKLKSTGSGKVEIEAGNGARDEGHLINTKRGKRHRLLFTRDLIEKLYIYLDSDERQAAVAKSFYGKSDVNYVFLTSSGNPYYISKQEIKDRQNQDSHYSVNSSDFVQNKGDTVRINLRAFQDRLAKTFADFEPFKFHDLRATFGTNLVRELSQKGCKSGRILSEVKSRMGHARIETTQLYLDFDLLTKEYDDVTDSYEKSLFLIAES